LKSLHSLTPAVTWGRSGGDRTSGQKRGEIDVSVDMTGFDPGDAVKCQVATLFSQTFVQVFRILKFGTPCEIDRDVVFADENSAEQLFR
jgi:hypothetical protein